MVSPLPWPLPQLLRLVIYALSINVQQGSLALLHSALREDLGLPRDVLATADKANGGNGVPIVPQGLTASIGGQFVRRVTANYYRRPECDDALIRSRLWQRVLEDLRLTKNDPEQLAKGLPAHSPAILGVEKDKK